MADNGKISDETLILMSRSGKKDVIDMLLERYKGNVRRKAKAMFLVGGDEDDLIQEGMIGLYKAIRDYRFDSDASFSTFASMCINRQMCTAVTKANRRKNQPLNESVSLDMPAFGEENAQDGQYLIDVLESNAGLNPESLYLDKEELDRISSAIRSSLSSYERVVLGLYLDGMDYIRIADRLQKQPKSVDNALQRIRAKIKGCVNS